MRFALATCLTLLAISALAAAAAPGSDSIALAAQKGDIAFDLLLIARRGLVPGSAILLMQGGCIVCR